ncbi:MAG TPA: YqaE/Pmp3 family membrane protein [Flavobacteriaceae bacterium]|nr:YqaE/Pmp3 family membrane protein [Flavobacteriaceae bacterium]
MDYARIILTILFPPLAILDKGCGVILLVMVLTLIGWIPGVVAALFILNNTNQQ